MWRQQIISLKTMWELLQLSFKDKQMIHDTVAIKGTLSIKKYNENNALVDERYVKNLVVAAGKDVIAARLVGNTLAVPSHMAIGTSNTAALTSQTALGTEAGRVSLDSTTRTNNTIAYVATFPAGTGTGVITEAGIFNAAATGSMLCRTNFNAVNKAAGDSIVITWNVTIA